MNEKSKNTELRKLARLSYKEWLPFFIFPLNLTSHLKSKSANQIEKERFVKFGFEKKIEQAETAQVAGILFYGFITLVVIIIQYL